MVEAENAIVAERVSIYYKNVHAVEDASFSVKAGEAYGLIGLNGAGKTSLIKNILGLRRPNHGTVRVFGRDPKEAATRLQLAYLPERFSPSWFLSGLEFIQFSLRFYGLKISDKAALEMAERVALDPASLKRRVQTYSKGMRQKTGLLAAILSERPLLILDEPMSGLDPLARSLVKELLGEQKKVGRTLFLSSHILADMDEMCDRVAVLDKGRVGFIGRPADLRVQTGKDTLEQAFLHSIVQKDAA